LTDVRVNRLAVAARAVCQTRLCLAPQGAPNRRADRLAMRRALELHQTQRLSLDGSPASAAMAAAAAAARPFGVPPPDSPRAATAPLGAATEAGWHLDEALGARKVAASGIADVEIATAAANGGRAAEVPLPPPPQMLRVISVGARISEVGGGS